MGEENENVKEMLQGGEPAEVNPATQQTEQAETARSKALARVRGRNAERSFADDDDESLYGAINEDYDADQAELEGYRGDASKWNEFLSSDDKASSFINDWQENGSPVYALVEEYGEDILNDLQNPENKAMIQQRESKRLERIAKEKELDEVYNKNIEQSKALIDGLVQSGKFTEEQIDQALQSLTDKHMKFITGQFDEQMIADEIKTANYDADVAKAGQEGEVRGKNKNISREFGKRRSASDGVPSLNAGGSPANTPAKAKPTSVRRSMWD